MVGALQFLGAVTLIFVFLGAVVIGLLGIVPVWSDVLMARSAKDLGVKYSEADYASGIAKIPGHRIIRPEGACLNCSYGSSGTVFVDTSFTQEEFTAQLNKLNSENGPARDIQIKFNNFGIVEFSCFAKDPRLNAPIYARGEIISYEPKNVKVEIEYLEVGRIGIPYGMAQVPANDAIEAFIGKNPGLSVERLIVTNGTIYFRGTFPQEIVGETNQTANRSRS